MTVPSIAPILGPMANTSETEEVDLLVLGSGEASKFIAWTFAKQGWKVVVVERRWIGGSCPNIACLPTKNLIYSSKVASLFRRGGEFGLPAISSTVNMSAVRDRKREMVRGLVKLHEDNFANFGVELLIGEGRFVGPKTVQVKQAEGDRTLRGKYVVIGTGTRPRIGQVFGLEDAKPLTHVETLELAEIPKELLLLGGGYSGLEFAQAFRRLGSAVTLIDHNSRLLPQEDAEVSDNLATLFANEGIRLVLDAKVIKVTGRSGEAVHLDVEQGSLTRRIEGTHLLVTAGRIPNTQGIGLEEMAGVNLDINGYIVVNEHLETSAEGVFAVGDCNGGPQFTHVGFDDFRVVRDVINGVKRSTRGRTVPSCLFTDPEFARIGMTEAQAREQGLSFRLFSMPMRMVLRTRTLSETDGFMKLIAGENDQILGFACLGFGAGEILAVVQIAMNAGLPYTFLRDTMFTHPTLAEGLIALLSSQPKQFHASEGY